MSRIVLILLSVAVLAPTAAFAGDPPDACVQYYKDAATVQRQYYSESEIDQFLAKAMCGISNRNYANGFDVKANAVINAVPAAGDLLHQLNITSNQQFCSQYANASQSTSAVAEKIITPLERQAQNFNECETILTRSKGTAMVTHQNADPGNVFFYVRFFTSHPRFFIQGITADGGFTCVIATKEGRPIRLTPATERKIGDDTTINCARSAASHSATGFVYPPATITLSSNYGPYTARISEETILGPATKQQAEQEIQGLKGKLALLTKETAVLQTTNSDLVRRLNGVHVEAHAIYFGEHDGWPNGQHFTCDDWHKSPDTMWADVQNDVCKGSTKLVYQQYDVRRGGCGYNMFVTACLYMPK